MLNDTKQHSKYHQILSDVCSKYIGDKYDEIVDDIKRIFGKCKGVGQASHNEIFKVITELHGVSSVDLNIILLYLCIYFFLL